MNDKLPSSLLLDLKLGIRKLLRNPYRRPIH